MLLAKNLHEKTFSHLDLIFIHHFSKYNKKYGWTKGNILLKNISKKLIELEPNSYFFRIHGDDFIIVNSSNNFKEKILDELQRYISKYSTCLSLTSKRFDIEKDNIKSLADLEDIFFS